jgi:hypothetical protein
MDDDVAAVAAQTADSCCVGVRREYSDKEFKRRHSLKAFPWIDQALLPEPIRSAVHFRMARYAGGRGAARMIAAPARHTVAPIKSQRSGRAPSMDQSQRIEATM